jgi:hypothetical protein
MGIVIKTLKIVGVVLLFTVLSIACGLYWEHVAWTPCASPCPDGSWLRYFFVPWLTHLIDVDGEGYYDALTVEVIINFFVFFLATWLIIRFFRRKRHLANR